MMNKHELELYVHIPFCIRKCNYCDFNSNPAPEWLYGEYVNKLIEEIVVQSGSYQGFTVTSIFIGGGTPSVLPEWMMENILIKLHERFYIADDAEITIEANPGTLTMAKLETYFENGVNRLSIGLQSVNEQELKALGRIHTYETFLRSYQRARQVGFTNINVDLMSSLPGQTLDSWKNTLKKVLMLKPEHISAYSLTIEEGTPFYEKYGEHSDLLPDEELDRQMYYLAKELIEKQGYRRYEISNYARNGYECRHNNGYWTGVNYLGLGVGASSYTHGYRFKNVHDLDEYLKLDFQQAGAAAIDIHELTDLEKMEEFMILGLRRMEGVSGVDFMERFGLNMWNVFGKKLNDLKDKGLLEVRLPEIRLTPLGIDVSNVVFGEFLMDE